MHVHASNKFEMFCTKKFDEQTKKLDEKVGIKDDEKDATKDEAKDDKLKEEFQKYAKHNLCFIFKNQISQHSLV